MKCEIACYVVECDTCRRVKAGHLRPVSLLQPLNTLDWKSEDISMDFIMGLPLTTHKFDSIWVNVDRLTKFAHFIHVKTHYREKRYAELCIERMGCPTSSSLTEELSSSLISGSSYLLLWVPT
jgi:hypothetical protein